ncbi:MAG: LuxR C-terminal-related transcriptional regulator [Anaerolineaceae bacterium]
MYTHFNMSAPLLLTKLFIPPNRAAIVARPGLTEHLTAGIRSKLTLISAPAGFGKTTLVSSWLADSWRHPVAWLSLDEEDNDLSRFLAYFIKALQTIVPKIGEGVIVTLQSPQPAGSETLLTTLLNEIAAIPDPLILVLDDYHVIDSEPINQAITFLLDHLPAQMHLIITTREDPSLPLSRYRVRGQLTELRAADLRFTTEETGVFLNQMMNLDLPVENIAALEARTEGWIAGLQLAALSMQGREDTVGFIQAFTGSHRFVLDYLVEEVLQHQSENIRSFLLQTAILDRFCSALCNAVTEREDGKEMLDYIERNNLFLVPLDDQRQWHRYHHLFAEVLQVHLMELQPDLKAALHSRASAWYEHNGLRSDAIRHALAAEDFKRAADLIELAWPATEDKSIQPNAWFGWVKALPEPLIHARPVLNVCYAYALLGRGEIEAAEARLKDAEKWLKPADNSTAQLESPSVGMVVVDQEQFKSLPAAIAVGRAYIAQAFGNIADTVRFARQALEFPDADPFRHSQAAMMLGLTYWASGNLIDADRVFADYTMKLRTAGNIPDAISTNVVLADIRFGLGRLAEAINTIEELLQFVLDQGEPISPDTADLHRELSELYLEKNNLETAAQHLKRSMEMGEKAELPVWRYRRCIAQARLHESRGDLDGALALLDEAERLYIRTPLPDSRPISAMKARIWAAQNKATKALEWAHAQGLSPDDDLCYLREFEHITLARILITQYQNGRMDGSFHMVMRLLDRLLQAAEEGGRMGSVIEILVLQAIAHQVHGSITTALVSLERALTLAEPEGYARIFLDEGRPMEELLKRAGKNQSSFLEKRAVNLQTLVEHEVRQARGKLVEPLSERELKVLRLLGTEMNGPEIAHELMVSLSTLRTHTQNIYTKLGVNNRRAAIRRTEELNLL